jgi:hypothetical protein
MDTTLAKHEHAARFDIALRDRLAAQTDAYARTVDTLTRREMRFTTWGNADCEVNRSPDGARWLWSRDRFVRSGT